MPREKKITFEFQTIDSKLTARGAGVDAIGRELDNAADAFTNIFLHTAMFAQILHRKMGVTKNNSSFICSWDGSIHRGESWQEMQAIN